MRIWKGKSIITAVLIALLLLSFSPIFASAAELTGEEIIKKARDRETPQTSYTKIKMTLINKKGGTRLREMMIWGKKIGKATRSVTRFLSPPDVRGTGFLYREVPGGKDEQFIYLPSLQQARRIAMEERSSSFMGSDFTYQDMERRDPEDDTHILLGEEDINGKTCYRIESKAKDPESSPYSKVIHWIRKDILVPVKADFYDKHDQLQKQLNVENLEQLGKYWISKKSVMEDVQKKHKTVMEMLETRFDQPIPDENFTERFLQKP
jgi:hypothetical protein